MARLRGVASGSFYVVSVPHRRARLDIGLAQRQGCGHARYQPVLVPEAVAALSSTGITDARNKGQLVKVLKKILLIDHDTRVTRIVRRALETAGKYSVREEHDAAFAIRAARWFRPDLVMIDLATSATVGTIITKQLQNDQDLCDIPLFCLSNFALERQFSSAGILRGYSFEAVPVKIDQLLRAVEQLLFGKE
jgi:CheY-like chemotaxis protein